MRIDSIRELLNSSENVTQKNIEVIDKCFCLFVRSSKFEELVGPDTLVKVYSKQKFLESDEMRSSYVYLVANRSYELIDYDTTDNGSFFVFRTMKSNGAMPTGVGGGDAYANIPLRYRILDKFYLPLIKWIPVNKLKFLFD